MLYCPTYPLLVIKMTLCFDLLTLVLFFNWLNLEGKRKANISSFSSVAESLRHSFLSCIVCCLSLVGSQTKIPFSDFKKSALRSQHQQREPCSHRWHFVQKNGHFWIQLIFCAFLQQYPHCCFTVSHWTHCISLGRSLSLSSKSTLHQEVFLLYLQVSWLPERENV